MADRLAREHQAKPGKRQGRRTVAEEAQEYLRKNGLRAVPTASGQAPGPDPESPAGPAYVVDPGFIRKMAEVGLKGIESWQQRQTYLTALKIGADKDLAKQLAAGNGAPPGAIEVMSLSIAEISQKYGFLSQWSPEVALVLAAGAWITAHQTTMNRLKALHEPDTTDASARNGRATTPGQPGHNP